MHYLTIEYINPLTVMTGFVSGIDYPMNDTTWLTPREAFSLITQWGSIAKEQPKPPLCLFCPRELSGLERVAAFLILVPIDRSTALDGCMVSGLCQSCDPGGATESCKKRLLELGAAEFTDPGVAMFGPGGSA